MKKSILISFLVVATMFTSCRITYTPKNKKQTNETTEVMNPSENNGNSSSSSFVQPKEPLLGKWQLDYLSPTSGKDISHFKIQKPYLNFVSNEKVAGNNGCNNIAGEYKADERKISFQTDKFGSTRMFCEGVDEKAFINTLASVNRYAVMDDGLKLIMSTDDVVMLSFTKVNEPKDLPTR